MVENITKAQELIELQTRYNLLQALPKRIPTLIASNSGNHTRPNNVFVDTSIIHALISCQALPEKKTSNNRPHTCNYNTRHHSTFGDPEHTSKLQECRLASIQESTWNMSVKTPNTKGNRQSERAREMTKHIMWNHRGHCLWTCAPDKAISTNQVLVDTQMCYSKTDNQ